MVRGLTLALALSALQASMVTAQDPGLAWLSRSVELSPRSATDRAALPGPTPWIERSDIDAVRSDALGILPRSLSGLPSDFWGLSPTAKLAGLLRQPVRDALPATRGLRLRILMAELDPPRGPGADGDLLLARVDGLLAMGALDQAEAMLASAQVRDPHLFQRWFDIGLLTGRAQEACAQMLADPGLRPTLPARIFCLARAGDWQAAAITLRAATALGDVDPQLEPLLARFLDPELFEGEPDPPAVQPVTPLIFTMREALSLPRASRRLPMAYLGSDLRGYLGWKAQIEATERLVRAQALPPEQLIDVYLSGQASASGGVWERVAAVHQLDKAVAARDPIAVGVALQTAYGRLARVGLEFALVRSFLPRLSDLDLTGQAQEIRFYMALMHRGSDALAPALIGGDPADPFLVALARGQPETATAKSPVERAVQAGFAGRPSGTGSHLRALIDASRTGEAVLRTLLRADRSLGRDPAQLQAVVATLIAAGLADDARRIALQAMILQPGRQQ